MRDDYIIYDGELYHYGRKGMKWGQHIFGKVKESLGRRTARRKELRERERLKKTPLRKLTSEEIKRRSEILDEEKMIRQKERDIKNLNPEKVSAGKEFISKMNKDVISPVMFSFSKKVFENFINKTLGKKFGVTEEEIDNAMELLKKPLEELTDKQIKTLAKRAEDTSSIRKTLLGKKEDDENTDDGTNSLDLLNKDRSKLTDAERKRLEKAAEQQTAIDKAFGKQKKTNDDQSDPEIEYYNNHVKTTPFYERSRSGRLDGSSISSVVKSKAVKSGQKQTSRAMSELSDETIHDLNESNASLITAGEKWFDGFIDG